MNRFFLIAIAAGLLSPAAAKAETIWLFLENREALEKIEVSTMDECHELGKSFIDKGFGLTKGHPEKKLHTIYGGRYKCLTVNK